MHAATMRFCFCLLALLASCGRSATAPQSGRQTTELNGRPNFLLVLLDDLATEELQYMPQTIALVRDRGASYESAFVSASLCAPSRASILRGQYPHNTKVWGNSPPSGGYLVFRELEGSTLATWLHDGGYRTALMGKYINQYGIEGPLLVPPVPPGWDEWYAVIGTETYFGYSLNENGTVRQYGFSAEDYLTDVLAAKTVDFIRRAAASKKPFFAYVAVHTPHTPSTPAPRHAGLFADLTAPRPPSFNETDVSDKPFPFDTLHLMKSGGISRLDSLFRMRIRSLQAVDEAIATFIAALRAAEVLDQTYIIVTSDNGFHLGQHRLRPGKGTAYEEDIRVPLTIRGPAVSPGVRLNELVLNTDLAPTIAALAGVRPPSFVDGRSVVPGLNAEVTSPRRVMLFELGPTMPDTAFRFRAIRTRDSVYIETTFGGRELYDLSADSFELENAAAGAPPPVISAFAAQLRGLERCAGETCRALEDR